MSSSAHPKALAAADQRLADLTRDNTQMIDGAKITPADQVAYTAIEALAALYIECAQARTQSEEGR